jgi:putative cell wall-binding protein
VNKKTIVPILILLNSILIGSPVLAATNLGSVTGSPQSLSIDRLSGNTRYETAKVISEHYANGKVKNVILSTGNDFADALSASVLAHQKDAPILLVDTTVDNTRAAFDYIVQHLESTGKVYIIGGFGIVGREFETKLNDLGFGNVVRIAGRDRYETAYKIASSLKNETVSTVTISSGEQYPDALSISSFAANKGWPILLTSQAALPQETKDYLKEKKPSKVYITGGEGAISENVKSEINALLPQANVERLMGQSRFDTNINITDTFIANPTTIYLATGYGFADALAGSVMAAKDGNPILFIDPSVPSLPKSAAGYFSKLSLKNLSPNIVVLGGSGVVPDDIIQSSKNLISGKAKETSIHSIDDITATVTQNEAYSLPTTVQARLYNSDILEVPVKWNSMTVDTSQIGLNVFEGIVEGYDKTVRLQLMVNEPSPIAEYTTYFDPNQVNRTENIRLSAKALDGKRLAPWERFSFNGSVGERTAEAGYKEAMIIEGKEFVLGLGGGVCQVSSTLYNAVSIAGLEILERHAHSLEITYVPYGQDATVAYGVLDFRFRNNTDNSLLIRSFVEGNTLTFKLYEVQ